MVGYKQPPAHTQFKKGQSGNPKGRPKKSVATASGERTANGLALQEAERSIKIREGEDVREVMSIEGVFRAQIKSAIQGNPLAQRDAINRYEKAEAERRAKIAESCEFWESYIERSRAKFAAAAAKGEPPPKILPHPDDIIIDYKKGVSIPGPADDEELLRLEKTIKMRDLYIMQDALDLKSWPKPDRRNARERVSVALFLASLSDKLLPKRFRLSECEFIDRMMEYRVWTKRALARELYQGWRSIGLPLRRGVIFPPWRGSAEEFRIALKIR